MSNVHAQRGTLAVLLLKARDRALRPPSRGTPGDRGICPTPIAQAIPSAAGRELHDEVRPMQTTESSNGSPVIRPSSSPVLDIDGLAQLLHRDRATLIADRCRAPHRVPPAYKIPGTKWPLWILEEVLDWLRQHPENGGTRQVGRPTKAQQMHRRAKSSKELSPRIPAIRTRRLPHRAPQPLSVLPSSVDDHSGQASRVE